MNRLGIRLLLILALLPLWVVGCGQSTPTTPAKASKDATKEKSKEEVATTDGHKHTEWWCPEHGIPEDECSMCSTKVAHEFKKKGDWCEQHNRAMSQCFICKPERREFYAAKYKAKYGKEPPPPEDLPEGSKPEEKKKS